MVFGQVAPRSPYWWAPWVFTVFFGAIAAFLTYGFMLGSLPSDRGMSGDTFYVVLFWIVTAFMLVRSIVTTVKHVRARQKAS